jgi:hypothetical protein
VTWVRDLLKRPLKLERRDGQVHVVLGEKAPEKAKPAAEPTAGEVLRRGHEELRALLRRHPETRHLMRHLGFIEQELARSGSRALKRDIPVPVLRKGVEQLDLLMRGEPSVALADLRTRIDAAAQARERTDDDDAATRPGAVDISEASQSLFDEMERSWTGQTRADWSKVAACRADCARETSHETLPCSADRAAAVGLHHGAAGARRCRVRRQPVRGTRAAGGSLPGVRAVRGDEALP